MASINPKRGTIPRDGINIFYEFSGAQHLDNPTAIPLIFLHNTFTNRQVYNTVIEALMDNYPCIAIDWRGMGESEDPPTDYSVFDLVQDVIAVLEQESISKAVFIGTSIGSSVSLVIGSQHPEKVLGLVLMGCSGDKATSVDAGLNYIFQGIVSWIGLSDFTVKKVLPNLFGKTFRANHPEVVEEWVCSLKALHKSSAIRIVKAWTHRPELLPLCERIMAPTIVVVGDEDISCPLSFGKRVHEHIKGSELVTLTETGHTLPLEQPAKVTEVIQSFLQKVQVQIGN